MPEQSCSFPELWPPQLSGIAATLLAIRAGQSSGLIVLPTGCGKTGMVLSLGRQVGVPMLFLCHREELVSQTMQGAARFWPGASVARIVPSTVGSWDAPDLITRRHPDLVVAMVPTLARHLASIPRDRFGLVVADEAHLSMAPTWATCLDYFQPGFLLGVTATPQRLDGKALGSRYGREPLFSFPLRQAIADGYLCKPEILRVETEESLDGVGTADGEEGTDEPDFNRGELARAVNTPSRNQLIVRQWLDRGRGRRTVAFCVDVPHCCDLLAAFRAAGVRAEMVIGGRPRDRTETLRRFAAGELDVVVNCEVLTTGFDDPGISCLLMARPTESRALYIQMVGRGLRRAEGKADCLVIDFCDLSHQHKLVQALHLLGRKDRESKPAEETGERDPRTPGDPAPIRDRPLVAWRLTTACPWPELPSLDGYTQESSWQGDPASVAQINLLHGYGLQLPGGLTKGEASYLITLAQEYEAAYPRPANHSQQRRLERAGLWREGMSYRVARSLIDKLNIAMAKGAR